MKDLKVSELASVRIRKYLNWKESVCILKGKLQKIRIGKCKDWTVSKLERVYYFPLTSLFNSAAFSFKPIPWNGRLTSCRVTPSLYYILAYQGFGSFFV